MMTNKQIIKFIKQHTGKSGIIYCLSRKKVDPGTWEAEAGESLEPRRRRLQTARAAERHGKAGDTG